MKKHSLKIKVFLIIILTFLITQVIMSQFKGEGRKIIFDKNTAYYRLIVYDKNNLRYLIFGTKVYQTIMNKNKPDKVLFEYARIMLATMYLKKSIKRALLMGLGGGSVVKYIKKYYPETYLDIAEIDPVVIKVAKKYFHMTLDNEIKAYAYDGRIFVKRVKKKYDVIMLDAFNSDYIPFHLMTREYLQEVKNKLSQNGFVMQNIWTNNALMKRILTTFKSEFKYVYLARGKTTGNAVILASNKKPDFSAPSIKKAYYRFKKQGINYNFHFIRSLRSYKPIRININNDLILTDEHAPVNYYHGTR